jgi:hypothetical protein
MKVAFITEMYIQGKVPVNFTNTRTEFAWMHAMDADHFHTSFIPEVKDYDKVFFIFPKGKTFLSAEGSSLVEAINPVSNLLTNGVANVELLKSNNKEVYFIQEGPTWWFNNYELVDQINFIKMIRTSDGMYAHNQSDVAFWKGYTQSVFVMPTLMIEETIKHLEWKPQDKTIIGGNFARWYGGMQSYIVAQEIGLPIYTISSHAQRELEDQIVQHLPRVAWTNWMHQLSEFKYAIHLMPTVAAGTFALNCAYFGIPCIGNEKVDTQRFCHPELAVDVEDVEQAAYLAKRLKKDELFYEHCSKTAKENYRKHYDIQVWKSKIGL